MLKQRGSGRGRDDPSSANGSSTASEDSAGWAKVSASELLAAQSRILKLSSLARLASITLLVLTAATQQEFDTSHHLLSHSLEPANRNDLSTGRFNWLLAFVRWDSVYFVASASPSIGYAWEQMLAFQPGIVALLRIMGYITPALDGAWSPISAILLATAMTNVAGLFAPVLLFRLGWRLTENLDLSYTAALLSILAPSAGTTLTSPTPEGFFSLASLMGMLALERSPQLAWRTALTASMWFAVATLFRSNGALLVGYIAFKASAEVRAHRISSAIAKLVVSAAVCVSPNVIFQLWAYGRFCRQQAGFEPEHRPWCDATPPSVYTFVQSHYWNVGFLRYWEPAQVPNFALAAPVLLMVAYAGRTYWRRATWREVVASIMLDRSKCKPSKSGDHHGLALESAPRVTPYMVHLLVLGTILLVASHVQIGLRLSTPGSMPAIWWACAHAILYSPQPWVRTLLISYLAMQYAIAIVMYAGHYPPA